MTIKQRRSPPCVIVLVVLSGLGLARTGGGGGPDEA
jgi:hypothetical protein